MRSGTLFALMAIAGVNAAMILFGWLQEKYEEPGKRKFVAFLVWVHCRNRPVDCNVLVALLAWWHW